jgi:glutamate-1-semialdehyde aminotransferase
MIHAALRLAGVHGPAAAIKFEGCYHGWYDDIPRTRRHPGACPADGSVPVRPMSNGQVTPAGVAVSRNEPDAPALPRRAANGWRRSSTTICCNT